MIYDNGIRVGDMVRMGVYVLGEWRPSYSGRVVRQSPDGTVSHVDVMSHHGGRPWIHYEQTSHLRKLDDNPATPANGEMSDE